MHCSNCLFPATLLHTYLLKILTANLPWRSLWRASASILSDQLLQHQRLCQIVVRLAWVSIAYWSLPQSRSWSYRPRCLGNFRLQYFPRLKPSLHSPGSTTATPTSDSLPRKDILKGPTPTSGRHQKWPITISYSCSPPMMSHLHSFSLLVSYTVYMHHGRRFVVEVGLYSKASQVPFMKRKVLLFWSEF